MESLEPFDMDSLVHAFQRGKALKFICFWGHTPKAPGVIDKECLSQWYPAPFIVGDHRFPTAEHYMMFQKAMLFDDPFVAAQILEATSPAAVKALGRTVRGFETNVWEQQRLAIVTAGSIAKFTQSPALRDFLVGTKKRILVEASPVDRVWGVGLAEDDPCIENPLKWRGLNLLGFALMSARSQLR